MKDLGQDDSNDQVETDDTADGNVNSQSRNNKNKGRRMVITEVDESNESVEAIKIADSEKLKVTDVKSFVQTAGNSVATCTVDDEQGSDLQRDTKMNKTPEKTEIVNQSLKSTMEETSSNNISGNSEMIKPKNSPINPEANSVPVAPIEPEPEVPEGILAIKDEGNSLYKNGQYGEASKKYSLAIDILRKGLYVKY